MTDLLGAILRPVPACMGCGAAATVDDDPFALCDCCEARLIESLKQSGFPASFGEMTAATGPAPRNPTVAAVTNSVSDGAPSSSLVTREMEPSATMASAPSGSFLDFEAEVSVLEACGFAPKLPARRNSTTLRVVAARDSTSKSVSVAGA